MGGVVLLLGAVVVVILLLRQQKSTVTASLVLPGGVQTAVFGQVGVTTPQFIIAPLPDGKVATTWTEQQPSGGIRANVSVIDSIANTSTGMTFGFDPNSLVPGTLENQAFMANLEYLQAIPPEEMTTVQAAQLEAVKAVAGIR